MSQGDPTGLIGADRADQSDIADGFITPVRQYAVVSIVIVLAALLAINYVSARVQRNSVESGLEAEAVQPARVGSFLVGEQISALTSPSAGRLLDIPSDIAVTDRIVLNAFAGQPVNRVDIVGPTGLLLYSTKHSEIGSFTDTSALRGAGDSQYMSHEAMGLVGADVRETVITSVPIFKEGDAGTGASPELAIVVYRDVTEAIDVATGAGARFRLLTLAIVMATLFGGLMLVVIRGHKIAAAARDQLRILLQNEQALTLELDRRKDELEAAINAKNTFLSVVTHELNNPIASVSALADVLGKNRSGNLNEREMKIAKSIVRTAGQLAKLASDLLDYSRVESKSMELQLEATDLRSLVREATDLMRPVLARKSQTLELRLDEEAVDSNVDPGRCMQLITNLLSNASKYSPDGSAIRVECALDQNGLRVSVTDSGIGISP